MHGPSQESFASERSVSTVSLEEAARCRERDRKRNGVQFGLMGLWLALKRAEGDQREENNIVLDWFSLYGATYRQLAVEDPAAYERVMDRGLKEEDLRALQARLEEEAVSLAA